MAKKIDIGETRGGYELAAKVSPNVGRWRCKHGHLFDRSYKAIGGSSCPVCEGKEATLGEISLMGRTVDKDQPPGYLWAAAGAGCYREMVCRLCGETAFKATMSSGGDYCRACDAIRARMKRNGHTIEEVREHVLGEARRVRELNEELTNAEA